MFNHPRKPLPYPKISTGSQTKWRPYNVRKIRMSWGANAGVPFRNVARFLFGGENRRHLPLFSLAHYRHFKVKQTTRGGNWLICPNSCCVFSRFAWACKIDGRSLMIKHWRSSHLQVTVQRLPLYTALKFPRVRPMYAPLSFEFHFVGFRRLSSAAEQSVPAPRALRKPSAMVAHKVTIRS